VGNEKAIMTGGGRKGCHAERIEGESWAEESNCPSSLPGSMVVRKRKDAAGKNANL